ncbi:LIM-only protein, putative [Pediculus humanus corporis]|uniref:LIM-only protein, putative n=1 Tax=Pediculus humanus subsp. corporis TaxID=121224 RepID=E0VBI7_PEDHC|nr:LIM-only protein, putative [Pediculus humanus corporis]EEB10743.1 LIM-only protein, putative [Pediculus humanus corporis]
MHVHTYTYSGLGESNILSSASGRNIASISAALGATTVAQALPSSGPRECAGCGKRITERFLLKAIDLFWHEDCLKCGCCDCRLGEVGSTLYTKANLILCKRDYLRLFGTTGYCAACNKVIPAFEMVMRAKSNVYHLECFACQQCNHRFCVGDRFYLCDNKILCEYDYEERLVFANMAYNPSSLAHIRRQVGNLQSAGNNLTQNVGREPLPTCQINSFNTTNYVKSSGGTSSGCGSGGTAAPTATATATAATPTAPHHNHPHKSIRDDGSSGYGSPDSETFEPPQ